LLKITGELLNMTQVESGKIQLNLLPVDPVRIMNQAVSACRTEAEQKNIRMASEISESLPRVMADEEKTTWVIKNLLSNAIRYSHEFSVVKVEVKTEAGKIRFSVKDTGQGIAPEYRDKIFGRYFRVPGTQQEGTGLGLSISKEFIEAQGGSITFESDLGAGSVFSVYLNTVNS
jgi:signal transduction histidine kinase